MKILKAFSANHLKIETYLYDKRVEVFVYIANDAELISDIRVLSVELGEFEILGLLNESVIEKIQKEVLDETRRFDFC